jgi:arylsulfatase A-like enzyme
MPAVRHSGHRSSAWSAFGPRPRPSHLWLMLLAAATTGCGEGTAEPPSRNALPDVVLVSIDSLRFDHLGCYGYARATSPTIDRLAREGVRFETVASTSSWTLPAHAALLTGLLDSSHGVVDNGLRLARGARTLAAVLRDAGWRTAGFFGGPYLDPTYGFGEGFDVYQSCMNPAALSSLRDVTGPRTVEAVSRWLDTEARSGARKPFFLFLHLWDVHYDYIPPAGYAERFDPDYTGRLDARDLPENPAVEPGMSPRDFEHLLALYDGEILSTDESLGRILGELDRRGRLGNALVIVTSDHGEEFFEHGGKGHQKTLFDEVVRVPLLLRWPGHLDAGRRVREPVRLIDVMPTVLGLAGVRERPPMQGRDLGPLLRGEAMADAPALMELSVDRNDVQALRTADAKVISWRRAGVTYVYDLLRDPREERPLAEASPQHAAGIAALQRALDEAARFGASQRAEPIEIGADLRRRLGFLGYAADEAASPAPKSK